MDNKENVIEEIKKNFTTSKESSYFPFKGKSSLEDIVKEAVINVSFGSNISKDIGDSFHAYVGGDKAKAKSILETLKSNLEPKLIEHVKSILGKLTPEIDKLITALDSNNSSEESIKEEYNNITTAIETISEGIPSAQRGTSKTLLNPEVR